MKNDINDLIASAILNPKSLSEKSRSIVHLRSDVDEYCKKRIIEELEKILKFNMELESTNQFIGIMPLSQLNLAARIQFLKQKRRKY